MPIAKLREPILHYMNQSFLALLARSGYEKALAVRRDVVMRIRNRAGECAPPSGDMLRLSGSAGPVVRTGEGKSGEHHPGGNGRGRSMKTLSCAARIAYAADFYRRVRIT